MIILRSFFDRFPKEIEEAAILDGCTSLDIYWRIMMPVSWPAISVIVIWQFMTSWNEFILALVTMTSNEVKPLTLGAPGLQRAIYGATWADVRYPDFDYDPGCTRLLYYAAIHGIRSDGGRCPGLASDEFAWDGCRYHWLQSSRFS